MFGLPFTSEAGLGLRYDFVKGSELSRTKARKVTISEIKKGDIKELNAFAYLSQTLTLSPALSVNAALRYDRLMFDYLSTLQQDTLFNRQVVSQHKFSPKLNLYYTYSPSLRLYASAGIGFHSNDARVSVVADRDKILPSAYGTDLGFIYKPLANIILNAALWMLDLDQEFVYIGDEGIVEPSGKTRRYGLDLSARYQLHKHIFADADINLARPRFINNPEGATTCH